MRYTLQVFTGSWHDTHEQPEKILGRIEEISRRIPVERVIIGWNGLLQDAGGRASPGRNSDAALASGVYGDPGSS